MSDRQGDYSWAEETKAFFGTNPWMIELRFILAIVIFVCICASQSLHSPFAQLFGSTNDSVQPVVDDVLRRR